MAGCPLLHQRPEIGQGAGGRGEASGLRRRPLKTEDPEAVFARAVDILKKLAPVAQEQGVVIAVETMPAAGE